MFLFLDTKSILRILIATTVFSLSIDIPDTHEVFPFGAPSNIEQYLKDQQGW